MCKLRPDLNIGANLRKLRKNRGLTQEQMVARLQIMEVDVSCSIYSRHEHNRLNICVSEPVAMRRILGCRYEDFFEGLESIFDAEAARVD